MSSVRVEDVAKNYALGRTTVPALVRVFEEMFSSQGKASQQMESGLLGDAEDEIDKLFGV